MAATAETTSQGSSLRDLPAGLRPRRRLARRGRASGRFLFLAGVVAGLALALHGRAEAKVRVAIPEFRLEGSAAPALELQLQDGFVLGLVRHGVQVLDPVDTGRRLESKPEILGCESSACLKTMGQTLDARYVVRVKVSANGNSYKMVARLFSTEGAAPAALPIATKSMPCDVCTVAEARDVMLRLADAIRTHLEEPAPPPPPVAVRPPADVCAPATVATAGLAVAATGAAMILSRADCNAATQDTACQQNGSRLWLGLALIAAGVTGSAVGTYVVVARLREGGSGSEGTPTATVVSLAGHF